MPRSANVQRPGLALPDLPGAACAGRDPELWFSAAPADVAAAAAVCGGCPERAACGQWADKRRERFGMWGGVTRSPGA